MRYKGFHRAPTNERCSAFVAVDQGVVQCVRYEGHPAAPFPGALGHRFRIQPQEYVHVCYRTDLAGVPRRSA